MARDQVSAFEKALVDEGIAGTQLEDIARSIHQQESAKGKNTKTSNAGAVGQMQIVPRTFKAYHPTGNIKDPYDNAVGGLRYIKDLAEKAGDDIGLVAAGYWRLATGNWRLATGGWQLAAGNWQLATGNWRLA